MGGNDRGSLGRLGLYAGHPFHRVWKNMKTRCYNPAGTQWKWYGARGIKVCEEWQEFKNFHRDMFVGWKQELTLERKDRNKDYSKENCCWVTCAENNQNRSSTKLTKEDVEDIRYIYKIGKCTQSKLASMYGVAQATISEVILGKSWR